MTILDELAVHLGAGQRDIAKFLRTAPARYRAYPIPKRGGGERIIAQPSAALKTIQRFVLTQKLIKLPVHEAAAAYVKGRGIQHNADAHKAGRFILKLDFEGFFPSLYVNDWRILARKIEFYEHPDDPYYYERILFWGDGGFSPRVLSIGAPTSPYISNALLYDIDVEIAEAARRIGARYTRYADDITVSSTERASVLELEQRIEKILRSSRSPRLSLNSKKRGLYGPGERRMVTGVVITPRREISLGRDRKRTISSLLHSSTIGKLDVSKLGELKGLLGFAIAVEPGFIGRLREKYGSEAVDRVLKMELPPRAKSN